MSTSAPPPPAQNSTSSFAFNVIASLIATALVFAGTWLAGRQVPDETALQFSFSEQHVGQISSWYIRINNVTDVAFDMQVSPPPSNVLRVEYSNAGNGSPIWSGQLKKGQSLEAIFVLEDASARLTSATVQGMILATYQERNPISGVIESRPADVKDGGIIGFARSARLVFWFLLPIGLAGLIMLLAVRGIRWWKARPRP